VLIVNSDDFGASVSATDSAVGAFDEGLITSASAMVWMRDSARAARLAREREMPVGLHLNLTLPFRDRSVPDAARALQAALANEFDPGSWNRVDERAGDVDERIGEAIRHQLEAFTELFGANPSHIDGHHHIHVHPAVASSLPRQLPIRPVLHTPAELRRRGNARDRALRRRFRCADGCVSFQHVHPAFEGSWGLRTLGYARRHVLEVMVHPQFDAERAALHSREWFDALSVVQVGSYLDLRPRAGGGLSRVRRAEPPLYWTA
jgi:predicted glycoside hydrolase/deacetylase ChbG (UPF0249 family)